MMARIAFPGMTWGNGGRSDEGMPSNNNDSNGGGKGNRNTGKRSERIMRCDSD